MVMSRDDLHPPYPTKDPYGGITMAYNRAFEPFAEDYMLFVTSGGKQVREKDGLGQPVPQHEARLQYFREKYPLARP